MFDKDFDQIVDFRQKKLAQGNLDPGNGFLDHENIGVDTKIDILALIVTKLQHFYGQQGGHFVLGPRKCSPRVPKWLSDDSCSKHAILLESTKKLLDYVYYTCTKVLNILKQVKQVKILLL